jgi:outer membrane protein OmpA-like peptidoglycan-associated protein
MLSWLTWAWAQGQAPQIDAQLYRPSVDSRLSWVDEAGVPTAGPFGSLTAHYAQDPLQYWSHQRSQPVLHALAQLDLVAGYGSGPVRLAASVPVVARSTGWTGGETGLGDVGGIARISGHTPALDVGIDVCLWAPTSTVRAPVSSPGLAGEVALLGSRSFGPLLLAVNLGYRALPRVRLQELRTDDVLTARAGAAVGVTDSVGLTAELAGQRPVRFVAAELLPIELLAGGYWQSPGPWGLRVGAGRGLTAAVGTSEVRAVLAMSYRSVPRGPKDSDLDTIVDGVDLCSQQPEDPDAYRDEDGCPEGTLLVVHLRDEQGRELSQIQGTLTGGGATRPFVGSIETELPPGAYTVSSQDPDHQEALVSFHLGDGPPRAVDLVLHPRRGVVHRDRFEVDGEVFFEFGSDRILPESWKLLDEVADVLQDTPQIHRLRIEGHTDSIGEPLANLELSQRRAAAVRTYLIQKGIAPIRLTAAGLGESEPLVWGDDALNRRVEFFVELWKEI